MIKLYNYEVEPFMKFLLELELAGKQSRMRTKIVKILNERSTEIDNDRIELAKEYAMKEEDGTPITETLENGQTVYKMENRYAFDHQYGLLMREELIIVDSPDKQDMLDTVKDAILNTNQIFSGQQALEYDRWCEIVEG